MDGAFNMKHITRWAIQRTSTSTSTSFGNRIEAMSDPRSSHDAFAVSCDSQSICPLCASLIAHTFHRDANRLYVQCPRCRLVFVHSAHFPSREAEKAVYDQHQNDPYDARYRQFLSRLFLPLVAKLQPGARGLDVGSGPGPTLSVVLTEAGFPTAVYDPIYAPSVEVWSHTYDFVTASEVVEHLHRPRQDLERMWRVLKPRWLAGHHDQTRQRCQSVRRLALQE